MVVPTRPEEGDAAIRLPWKLVRDAILYII